MKYLIVALLLPLTAFADQTEIGKIDARLEELKTIWNENQGVINAYTKNRTQPVREGSREYVACRDASQQIQLAEREAEELKAKKKALTTGQVTMASDATPIGIQGDENWRVVSKELPLVEYDRSKHGPKIKDIFLGMSINQFRDQASKLTGTQYKTVLALQDTALVIITLAGGVPPSLPVSKDRYVVNPSSFGLGVLANQGVVGLGDDEGNISGVIISGLYSKEFFKAESLQLDKFVELFSESYQVNLEPILDNIPLSYEGVSSEGVKITISNDFGVTMIRTDRPSETKKAFD